MILNLPLGLKSPISISMILSGSVHLGLMLLLVRGPVTIEESLTQIELMEIEVPGPVIEAPPVPKVNTRENKVSPQTMIEAPRESDTASTEDIKTESVQAPGGESQEQLSAQDLYKRQIVYLLNQRKSYPKIAKQLRQQGRVMVQFLVNREGKILDSKVVSSSPFESLNQSAQNLVKNLNGLKPFPAEIEKATWLFTVPIDYQM